MGSQLLDVRFWKELAPKLHIGKTIGDDAFEVKDGAGKSEKLVREGYIHLASPGLKCPFEEIAKIFTEIVSRGLPPVFSFVYDELWMLNKQLSHLMRVLLHKDYALLPAFWAWRVAPGERGWKPHRDKLVGSLFPNKKPKSLTVWIPITEAHPLNGCMYVLPADRDPQYGINNTCPFPGLSAEELQEVRALPAKAGDVLVWTQHIFHWSGHAADRHDLPPRMSVSFEYQRGDTPAFKEPLLGSAIVPTFEERLALISKQVLQYRHMYGYHQDLTTVAEEIGKKYKLPDEGFTGVAGLLSDEAGDPEA
jgi:hypothetical protein